jgi:two-component system, probable response regulator PhcQ
VPRIMLVDDEPKVLSSLRRAIQIMPEATFQDAVIVETFDKPEQALARAADCEFDLVVSDWRMPLMNGVEFFDALGKIQPKVARLMLSGYVDWMSEIKAAGRVKILHFLHKPWDQEELRSLLRQILEHRRLLIANQRLYDLSRKHRHNQMPLHSYR